MTSDRIARIQARIVLKETALDSLYTALTESSVAVQSHRLATGDGGSVSTEYKSVHEIRNNIRILEREIDSLYRKLNGTGIVNMVLRRRIFQ